MSAPPEPTAPARRNASARRWAVLLGRALLAAWIVAMTLVGSARLYFAFWRDL